MYIFKRTRAAGLTLKPGRGHMCSEKHHSSCSLGLHCKCALTSLNVVYDILNKPIFKSAKIYYSKPVIKKEINRMISYFMEKRVEMTDESIFTDTSNTIKKAM